MEEELLHPEEDQPENEVDEAAEIADEEIPDSDNGTGELVAVGSVFESEADSGSQIDEAALKHVEHVRDLALNLYDATRPLHELNEGCRRVLAAAAMLVDAPIPSGRKKALRSARSIVEESVSEEFASDEESILVAIVALQNGIIKRKYITGLDLDPMQVRDVYTLLAIIRIAMGLDESRSQGTTITQVEPTKGKMWVVVDGPNAAIDAAAAQHNASLWENVGYPRIKILETSQAGKKLLPYPEPSETPGVESNDVMAEAGRKVLRYHFARMLSHEDGTRLGEDIEDLHKMRVATRRMRAAFVVFDEAFETQTIKPYIKGLRATARALGRVRDLDVFLEKARIYIETLSEVQQQGMTPLLQDWRAQRDAARARMIDYFDSEDFQDFKRKFNIFLSTTGAGARPIRKDIPRPHHVRDVAPVLIYDRLAEVRAFEPFLVDASIEILHALRIAMKKLRYTVEFFHEVLGQEAASVIDEMKIMQDHLGDLNDAQVAAGSIQRFIDSWDIEQENLPISERQNPETIVSYLASRHAELHQLTVDFGEAWAHFNRPEFRRNLAIAVAVL